MKKIWGRQLRHKHLCKMIPENMETNNFVYHLGMNEDSNELNEGFFPNWTNGLHFCTCKNAYKYLHYGNIVAELRIPDDEMVYYNGSYYKSKRVEIVNTYSLKENDGWKYLINNGCKVTDSECICKMIRYGLDVFSEIKLHYSKPKLHKLVRCACEYDNVEALELLHTKYHANIVSAEDMINKERNKAKATRIFREDNISAYRDINETYMEVAKKSNSKNVVKYLEEHT